MSDILAFAEQRDGRLRGVAKETTTVAATVASGLGGSVEVLALGGGGLSDDAGSLGAFGADRIRVAEHDALSEYNPEGYARVVANAVQGGDFRAVVFPATGQGKDLAPRVAALLDVPLSTEATDVDVEGDELVVVRPIYAGKAYARTTLDATPAVFSVRPNVFQPVEREGAGQVETFTPDLDPGSWGIRVRGFEAAAGELDVAEASIVVSGGRGLGDPENWHLLEDLRDALGDGAALGASRAVVDAGWRPHAEQVGQTGKTVAPRLYFAIGISGAIQHLAGMRTAGTIVAVNKDPEAPIFDVADYGIVGDLFEVVPRLTEEIRALKD
ncbi:MAG: electron transfer flavoprotein subunit alpha/FixB family protein [Longimicrobiales bacterium]|nr:electron transfer flavoprotein subunit alpha/FixB family protein [Longimicrobiales bacterium]